MYKIIVITFSLVISYISQGCAQVGLKLAETGKSTYRIIVPNKATAIEMMAANEFQRYFQRVSDIKLPIVRDNTTPVADEIVIGKTNRASGANYKELNEDGLLIRTIGKKLFLTGGGRKGVLYSVYTFFEEYLGCRMYAKDELVIPQRKDITIASGISNKQLPSFAFRTTHFKETLDTVYCNWHKLNFFFEGWGLFAHTVSTFLPPGEYFDSHPEYFALYAGKRVRSQLCPSHPDVAPIVISRLAAEVKKKPQMKYWSVSQNDDLAYCQCDMCEKIRKEEGSPQGAFLRMVNKVAARFPDKVISTLAYRYSQKPPLITKPGKNVLIMLASLSVPRGKAIPDEPKAKEFRNDLEGWKKLTQRIFIWDYVVQFTNTLSPFPNLETLQPNIRFFKNNGITDIFEQGVGGIDGEFSTLRAYMISKLLWNANLNFTDIRNEFLDNYYGKQSSGQIKEYIDAIESEAKAVNAELRTHGSVENGATTYLSRENLERYQMLLKPALETSKGTKYYDRVTRVSLPITYAWLQVRARQINGKGSVKLARAQSLGADKEKQEVTEVLANFINDCKRVGIMNFDETGKGIPALQKEITNQLNPGGK
jgi:hypothetical protein